MRFRVLGPLEIETGNGSDALGGRKQRLVLAHLLRRPNAWVPVEVLIDDVWGDEPPAAARGSLQAYISHLRKMVGADRLEGGAGGYRLAVAPDELDALEFERTAALATTTFETDAAEASALYRRALDLWRGSAYADLTDEPSLLGEIGRLDEERLGATERRIDADLALGRHAQLVGELDDLTRTWPLREHFWAQRMLVLYRAERPAEALAAFREARSILIDELGVEPGRPLQQLNERILLQDPELDLPTADDGAGEHPVDNPYKGLRPFREGDAQDFHGREALTDRVVATIEGGARLVALVGPSGSGKSSVVYAGVIPTIRGRRHDEPWAIATMRPGAHPFTELDAALARMAPALTGSTEAGGEDTWLLEAVLRALPDDGTRLLLVIDQLEELFTLVDEVPRNRFLAGLVEAAREPGGRLRVLATLRADFFDRPLAYPDFGKLLTEHVVPVLPLGTSELEAAATRPAERVGVALEQGLVTELVGDVGRQPNALPLFQYALTELFDRRDGEVLTLAGYEGIGGLRRAVASRAEDTFRRLDAVQQEAARQLFLRLVRVGAKTETRRVMPAAELASLDIDLATMQEAVEEFVSNRLLTRDRDPVAGDATVEVAHEALISEWDRLGSWLEEHRGDLRTHANYAGAIQEWVASGRDDDFLLSGGRLERYAAWRAGTTLLLTLDERDFIDEAIRRRDEAAHAEAARARAEERMRSRTRRRAFALGMSAAAVAAAVILVVVLTNASDDVTTVTSVVYGNREDNQVFELTEQGLVRADRDLDIEVIRADVLLPVEEIVADGIEAETDLMVFDATAGLDALDAPGALEPPTHYVINLLGQDLPDRSNVTGLAFSYEQSGFLAGVAAASSTQTGIVGYVGAFSEETPFPLPGFRAGYEEGVEWVDPDVRVVAAYISDLERRNRNPYSDQTAAERLALAEFELGADVVYHAAGGSGFGVFEAAAEASTPDRHLWAIGVDTDQWQTVSADEQEHLLTSTIIRFDLVFFDVIRDFVNDALEPGVRLITVDGGYIDYSTSGDHLDEEAITNLDRAIEGLATGAIVPPTEPSGRVIDPLA